MSDQREFKVGDWVVSTRSGNKLWHLDVCEIKAFHKHIAITYTKTGVVHHNINQIRHATPAEITAGHRIDEPLVKANAIPFTKEDVEVKDAVREAFEKWFKSEFECTDYYFTITHFNGEAYRANEDWNPIEDNAAWVLTASFRAWKACQSEVDELQFDLQAQRDETIEGYGKISKLRNDIQVQAQQLDKFSKTIDSYSIEVDEKQKRIDKLLTLTKFVKDHFEMNDLNKAMPRVYEEICEALGGGA